MDRPNQSTNSALSEAWHHRDEEDQMVAIQVRKMLYLFIFIFQRRILPWRWFFGETAANLVESAKCLWPVRDTFVGAFAFGNFIILQF